MQSAICKESLFLNLCAIQFRASADILEQYNIILPRRYTVKNVSWNNIPSGFVRNIVANHEMVQKLPQDKAPILCSAQKIS